MDASALTSPAGHTRRKLPSRLLPLEPQYRERVWGGRRLLPADPPIGEAWIAMAESVVSSGPLAGRTIGDLTAEHGAELLGRSVFSRYGTRFPLLAKFLDCADWLSVQVHPNDEQARKMVGPNEFGKTEAWYFVEAEPGARILLGVKRGIIPSQLAAAIREGRVTEVAAEVSVQSGQAVLIPAGTLHALGPGLLPFEIQEASDTTYRAYDWGRPQAAGRKLHIEESVAVMTTDRPLPPCSPVIHGEEGTADAIDCPYFDLDVVKAGPAPLPLDTGGRSFHIVACAEGQAELSVGTETASLAPFQAVIVAGSAGAYHIRTLGGSATLLRVAVPS
jgi:mannose-6-phosphate isomerase